MQPVHPTQRANVSFFGPMLLIFFLGVVLTCAVWFFWKSWSAKSTDVPAIQQTANPSATLPVESAAVVPPKPTPVSSAPEPILPVAQTKVGPASAAIEESSLVQTNAAPVTEVTPPPGMKLQGIFYRVSNPTALISGKTVAVGDKVEGAQVVKIGREEVTLQRAGETIVLTLP